MKLLGLAAGAVGMAPATAGTRNPWWRTAVGLNGFESAGRNYGKTYPLWEILHFASREGFDGVELVQGWPMWDYPGADEGDRVAALYRQYAGFGLQVFSIQLGADGAFDPDEAARRRWLVTFHERVRLARQVGCSCVGPWPGYARFSAHPVPECLVAGWFLLRAG